LTNLSLIFSLGWKIWLLCAVSLKVIPLKKPSHTHTHTHTHTHCMSWAIYFHYYVCKEIFAYLILVYRLYVCIILTCSLIDFSEWDTCVCYYTCEGPNHAALLSTFQLDVFNQSFCFTLVDFITLFTLVLLRPLGGVIFGVFPVYYSVLPFVPLWQKWGVIFDLDRDCIFKPVKWFLSQIGQRGSLLVCNWPHSVGQNHFYVMMLSKRDSAIQKCFQKILHSLQVRKFNSLSAVRTTCHTVWTTICLKHHPSGRWELSDRTFPYVEKFWIAPTCNTSGRPSVFDKL
jgi:hypothetical protein